MGSVNPIWRDPMKPVSLASKSKGSAQSASTAAKVNQIVQLPVLKPKGLRGREVTPLRMATDLSKKIQKEWNDLAPEELAEKIIELEDRVAKLTEASSAVDKIKRLTEHFHFCFVFPVALELQKSESSSFAKTVCSAANQVFKTNSLNPFNDLNRIQQQEVLQIAARRGA